MAEYVRIPGVVLQRDPASIRRIPDNMPFEHAAVMDPICNAYKAIVQEAKVLPGDNVVIYGNGPLGLFSVLVASAFLPFLPMLPLHLLIQNLLYDVSQVAIPFDNVDDEQIQKPQRWNPADLGRFMIFFGPISSIFDILTFCLMWWVFHANTPETQTLFQSGWFVVGLLSQTLIVHMIRTRRVPFIQSCASWPLMIMTVIVMIVGIALPFSPLASYLQLQALPLSYFPWLVAILAGYMTLTQLVKGFYSRRYGWQ